MNIRTQNGMGIVSKGITWKPHYGMGIKTSKRGMNLKSSPGMQLSQMDNYFVFDEYERKRKYFQMGSHIRSIKQQPAQAPMLQNDDLKMSSVGTVLRSLSLFQGLPGVLRRDEKEEPIVSTKWNVHY